MNRRLGREHRLSWELHWEPVRSCQLFMPTVFANAKCLHLQQARAIKDRVQLREAIPTKPVSTILDHALSDALLWCNDAWLPSSLSIP